MSFYAYTIDMNIAGKSCDVDVLYKYSNGHYNAQLGETIDKLVKRRLPPERILIMCPKNSVTKVESAYKAINKETQERIRAVSQVVLAPFNYLGKVDPKEMIVLHGDSGSDVWVLNDKDVKFIIEEGMKHIIQKTHTRMEAPSGYEFRKPSGNKSRVFIRAGNMAQDPAALAVIFHALIRTIPYTAKRLYIDSSTILSVALTYQQCMCSLAKECGIEDFESPTITNFHSYSKDPGLKFEGTEDYVILISATSSGGLSKELIEKNKARADSIFHLLVFSADEKLRANSAFFQLTSKNESIKDESFQKIIEIPGEEFLASHGDTRTVDIKIGHFPTSERKIYSDKFYQDAFEINLRGNVTYDGIFRPVTLSGFSGIGSIHFEEWLQKEAIVPLNTSVVVACDKNRSYALARYITSKITTIKGKKIPILTLADLEQDPPAMPSSGSILIVCSDESGGQTILDVSQALRAQNLHRHYLIGHLFPTSAQQYKRLENNLRTSGKDKGKYGWSIYCVTPLGDDLVHNSWLLERAFDFQKIKLPKNFTAMRNSLVARAKRFASPPLNKDLVFLPRTNGAPLELRADSILFSKEYNNVSHVTIYVQIAAALQRGRDKQLYDGTILSDELCFGSNPFIDTVIDPDTFSRFSDGVIQAAILRSALSSELNYSRDDKLSQHMLNIFSAIIKSCHKDRGEAVLEFLLAIALKKLRFSEQHYESALGLIKDKTELNAVWKVFNPEKDF